jgi:hypothetical protein
MYGPRGPIPIRTPFSSPIGEQVHHGSEQNDDPEQEPYKQDPSQGLACEVRKEVC